MAIIKKIKATAVKAKKYLSGKETYVSKGVKSSAPVSKKAFKPRGPISNGKGVGY